MDPLHLTRTGVSRPIFKMPAGDSADYYDPNRIFVPKGLLYVPEFTGKNHSATFRWSRRPGADAAQNELDWSAPAGTLFSLTQPGSANVRGTRSCFDEIDRTPPPGRRLAPRAAHEDCGRGLPMKCRNRGPG